MKNNLCPINLTLGMVLSCDPSSLNEQMFIFCCLGLKTCIKEEIMVSKEQAIDADKIERIANILKGVAHPVRLGIINVLKEHQSLTVMEINKILNIEQSLLSHHLIHMKDKGLLKSKRNGKFVSYELTDQNITNIVDCISKCNFI